MPRGASSIAAAALAAAVLALPTAEAARGPGVSLWVSSFELDYGKAARLSGVVSNHKEGVPVAILARSFSGVRFAPVVRVTTGQGGKWSASVKPVIATTYVARVGANPSRQLTVGVHPLLAIQMLSRPSRGVLAALQSTMTYALKAGMGGSVRKRVAFDTRPHARCYARRRGRAK